MRIPVGSLAAIGIPRLALAFFAGLPLSVAAEKAPLKLCVVQYSYGTDYDQQTGIDARRLSRELASHTLADRTSLDPVPMPGMTRKDARLVLKNEGCPYTVVLERYDSVNGSLGVPDDVPVASTDTPASSI